MHCLLRPSGRSFDVEALGRTHVLVPQDALDRRIFDTQFLEVGRETATVRVPALPLQAVGFEEGLQNAIGQVIEINNAGIRLFRRSKSGNIRPTETGAVFIAFRRIKAHR